MNNLKETFSNNNNSLFDNDIKVKVKNIIADKDFTKHEFKTKDLFELKDLNYEIKNWTNDHLMEKTKFTTEWSKTVHKTSEKSSYSSSMRRLNNQRMEKFLWIFTRMEKFCDQHDS